MHLEALTSETKKLWPELREFKEFVLAGGTALALQIGHRISVDFDFFSKKEIKPGLLKKVESVFLGLKVKTLLNTPDQLAVLVNGAKLTFVAYRFPTLYKPVEFQGVRLLQVTEIAATKAYALGRRATLKDYVDLYFIVLEEHCTLDKIVKITNKKYGDLFDPRLFFEQLVYLKDVPEEKIQFLRPSVDKSAIEKFFEQKIQKIKF